MVAAARAEVENLYSMYGIDTCHDTMKTSRSEQIKKEEFHSRIKP